MRAIRLDRTGPPDNLLLVDVPEPDLTPDGVLIRTAFAGMIYADAEARRGTYYAETVVPWFPGREVAGVVEAVGPEVTDFQPGDRVAALVFGAGCYAEKVLARTAAHQSAGGKKLPPSDIVRLPDGTDMAEALAYLINYRIAHLLVHAWAKVPRGARIVVHGASGGMGSMILELAAELDCESIAFVRTAGEADFCRAIGASHCVNVTEADPVEAVRAITAGAGVAYSFNGVGGPALARDPHLLAPFGEIHLYGYVAGKTPFDPFAVDGTYALKTFNADTFLRTPHFATASAAMRARFERGNLLATGKIFPLSDAAAAHRAIESGEICGKIVLQP
jgi:NADPH2:quinone reductase